MAKTENKAAGFSFGENKNYISFYYFLNADFFLVQFLFYSVLNESAILERPPNFHKCEIEYSNRRTKYETCDFWTTGGLFAFELS